MIITYFISIPLVNFVKKKIKLLWLRFGIALFKKKWIQEFATEAGYS